MTQPVIYAVCGLPGVGKTTFAEEIRDDRDETVLIRSDEMRQWMFNPPQYTPEETDEVYEACVLEAASAVERGYSPIIDATFRKKKHRDLVRSLGVPVRFYKVVCDEDVVRERLEQREGDASDADYEVYRELDFSPFEDSVPTIVDTTP